MNICFEPTIDSFRDARAGKALTVLAGRNNSGKSFFLKHLKILLGTSAYMVGTARFYHVPHVQPQQRDPNQLFNYDQQFAQMFSQEDFNHDQNQFDLQTVLLNLSDHERSVLFEICGDLLGTSFSLKKKDENNELSLRYVDMGGQNLSVGSTGARLLMTTLGLCLDRRFTTIIIDEPELGLSPATQAVFAEMLSDTQRRQELFPHIQQMFLATHSHLFLSRREITDNWIVQKNEDVVSATQVESLSELHRLQLNLLGNTLEALYLPAAIVIVEGKTDFEYLDRVLTLRFPDNRVTVQSGQGDVKRRVHSLRETFGDLSDSPFRNRIFVVLDSVAQPGLVDELVKLGVLEDHIAQWARNGIEYLYPEALLCAAFNCGPDRLDELTIKGDKVTLGDRTYTKSDLVARVMSSLDGTTQLPEELESRLLDKVKNALDAS